MNVTEQYELIEPDTITDVLKERGWCRETYASRNSDANDTTDVWKKDSLTICVQDGDQRNTLSVVFEYEGPEAVAEIWARSSGFLAPLLKYRLACEAGLPRKKIYCYFCGARHIDKNEWAKKPHHTHLCETCGKQFDVGEWSFGA